MKAKILITDDKGNQFAGEILLSPAKKVKYPKELVTIKKDFKGITGGIRLLISRNNFFKNQKKTFTSVKEALNKEGYFSSLQAIQGALDSLSTTQGPLKKIKEGKKNYYAERK